HHRALHSFPTRRSSDLTALICLENTHNRAGGAVLPTDHMAALREVADRHGIPVHLDGARLFNAAVALGVEAREIARFADSVSVRSEEHTSELQSRENLV